MIDILASTHAEQSRCDAHRGDAAFAVAADTVDGGLAAALALVSHTLRYRRFRVRRAWIASTQADGRHCRPRAPPRCFRATDGRDAAAPDVWLVLGRFSLVVARWERGDWRVERVRLNDEGMRVTPVAVFDLDGDGFPEIVAEENGGDSWDSVILKRSAGGAWTRVATSVNGSTA